jgi:hypothetical protein
VFSGRSPREELFADETPAHVLTDDCKHFPNLVSVNEAHVSPGFFVSSHVDQQ